MSSEYTSAFTEEERAARRAERAAARKKKLQARRRRQFIQVFPFFILLVILIVLTTAWATHRNDEPEAELLPDYDYYEIHYDPEKMFISQLKAALTTALANGDGIPSVRANVGCGALCTLYGNLKQTFFHDKMPWL